jgi:DNA repair exonuclease SbcCD ATPase subunit
MIEKIVHLSDIHIRKNPTRNQEYSKVFKNLIASLKKKKPDRIVIVGDLVHDYLDLQGEQLILACELLTELSRIARVIITRGNHDCRKKNLNRVDSIKAIVNTLNNTNIVYFDNTDVYYDDNVAWFVWHHGDIKNNPWKTKEGKIYEKTKNDLDYVAIDLFHDPITGCKSTTGFEMKSNRYYSLSEFKGDVSMLGDIHRMQYLDNNRTKAYSGSLIAQDFSEGDDSFHGYLLWDIKTKSVEEVSVGSDYSYKNIRITPYLDFDDLDYEIPNPTKYMKIRFVWGTLPQTRTKQNERKLAEYFSTKYGNITISHKNEFIEVDKIDINENITLENITDTVVQHEIFNEYLKKIGADDKLIQDVIALDQEISASIVLDDVSNIEWNIIKFGGRNFMSYHQLDIDWREMDGLFQITGVNTAGKTTIMKLIAYLLFGKTLETETRIKYGDKRFVNDRNNATFCDGYLVLEANGEYYGIKKKTEITTAKDGTINGAPTTLSFYILNNPDDEMNEETSLEKLDEDKRVVMQQKINSIIGSYDNFMRIVMTTSDTLNRILSNDMAVFIDSLLYDSGLDIFDKKLEGLKEYQKKANEKSKVYCDVDKTKLENNLYLQQNSEIEAQVTEIETLTLPDILNRIETGRTYVETLTKKLFKIDPEIYNLNVANTKESISIHNNKIIELKTRKTVLEQSIATLKDSYDVERLKVLINKKDEHKTNEYNKKLLIKACEQEIIVAEHQIEIFRGYIVRHKSQGTSYKTEIQNLKNSKTCPTCGQELTEEHQSHINDKIKAIESLMFPLANDIKKWQSVDIKDNEDIILAQNLQIGVYKSEIQSASVEMEEVLKEIGILNNDKNDVERRREFQNELNQIPNKIENEELKISILQQKIDNHENSLKQIEENHNIEKGITAAKFKLSQLNIEESDKKENVFIKKTKIGQNLIAITTNNNLITAFQVQEYRDNVIGLYKKCVHRDGMPKQILSTYILPKINLTLEKILSIAPFKIWLDIDDLRPKLVYNNRPASIIDCISASGKERTFASIVLKFALNQINVKAKPTIFLLDEVMGKLDENSVEEFIEILQLIKNNMKKVLIVEHNCEVNPDYLISVQLDEDGISSLIIE